MKIESGVHEGKTFGALYAADQQYVRWIIGRFKADGLRENSLIMFAQYSISREEGEVYMALAGDPSYDQECLAIIDSGCNNTCHGSRWMQRLLQQLNLTEDGVPLLPATGGCVGINGSIQACGRQQVPMQLLATDQSTIEGSVMSVKLADSDAPLLLSSQAQKKLGLVLDMSIPSAYSKVLGKELEIVDHNGLPGLRLGSHSDDHVASCVGIALHGDAEPDAERPKALKTVPEDNLEDEQEAEQDGDDGELPRYLPLIEGKSGVLTKGQRKMLQSNADDINRHDAAMWSFLTGTTKWPARQLPRRSRSFIFEIFAGAATLTCMAAAAGWPVSSPIDLEQGPHHDLMQKVNRERISRQIGEDDPYLLSFAPVCGPWSQWQHLNLTRGDPTFQKIMDERKRWYPVLRWMCEEIRKRLSKGREVLVENPWASMLWELRCMEDIHDANALTGEPLELVRLDQCAYGLTDKFGVPHFKPTGMLLSSSCMKGHLQQRCPGDHQHSHIEGSATKKAQQWPDHLCKAIIKGASEELAKQIFHTAYAGELFQEESSELPALDGVYDHRDVAH